MEIKKVIVIGGGAAGLFAAICAARMGAEVTVIEKLDKVGKKILATGNGRCNFTNIDCNVDYYKSNNKEFISKVFSKFNNDNAISFFEELGVFHKVEGEGRVYPYSEEATAILDVLKLEAKRVNVEFIVDSEVTRIEKKGNRFFVYSKSGTALKPDKVIIATGGMAGPQYGCSGDGYHFAKKLGHNIIDIKPGLVKVKPISKIKEIKGVRVKGAVSIVRKGQSYATEIGEIQFTDDALSGISVFNLSSEVQKIIDKDKTCTLRIDLFPEYTVEDLIIILQMRKAYSNNKTVEEFLIGLIKKKVIIYILKEIGITNTNMNCSKLKKEDVERIAKVLKQWDFKIYDTYKWKEAQVTTGGIDTLEIDSTTMESNKVKGLYFAGEVVDVDGICGGYNLQWAWASGNIAGVNSAK